jgi:hypothetical protein
MALPAAVRDALCIRDVALAMQVHFHFSPLVIALVVTGCSASAPDTPRDGGGWSSWSNSAAGSEH